MGLAILPARLKQEMEDLKGALLIHQDPKDIPSLAKHAKWAQEVLERHPEFNEQNASEILQAEIGDVFCHVLEDAGVYKRDEAGRQAFDRFLETL